MIYQKNRESSIKLFCEDCVQGMRKHLKLRSVDVVVTSPPYNIGKKYSKHRDNLPREAYLDSMRKVSRELGKVLKDDGSLFLNIGNTPKDQWIAWDVARVFQTEFVLQNVLHWVKSIAIEKKDVGKYSSISGDIAVGHFKPITSERFVNDCHEYIFHFTKFGKTKLDKLSIGVPYQDKTNIGRWKNAKQDSRDRGNTWFIPYETIQRKSQRPHPASFPEKLPEMCIKLHGLRKGLLVMDPFLGIGSSAVAAWRLGTSFVGFEIDKLYLHEATARIFQERARMRGA